MRFSFSTTIITLRDDERHWDLEGYLQECRIAEELGFDTAYKGERRGHGPHSGRHGVVNNAQLIAAYGLANTERLKFSTGVVLLPLYHPVAVIQDATMINAFYPGRYRLVVGAGYQKDDFDVFGVNLNERVARMRTGLEAMNAYREGRPYKFADDGPWSGHVPPPDPAMGGVFPEIWVGAWSEAGVKLAALGDGWETGPIRSIPHLKHLADIYRDECERLGKKPRIALLREACIADTDDEAKQILGPYILDYHRIYYQRGNAYSPKWEPWLDEIKTVEELKLEHVMPNRVLYGSPETWVETLKEWEELIGPEEIVVRLRYFHGPGLDVAVDSMRMISEHVMPEFR
ncbi:MAG: LLM class flavin-dependent oxidoreductase [Acidimicrobiia bacterium]|nr:LLM class flavin-dependent oxidoreductase [Acidimicrobiia bacterium]